MAMKPTEAPARYVGDPALRPTSPPPPRKKGPIDPLESAYAMIRDLRAAVKTGDEFWKASLLLDRLVTILDYQSDRFSSESVESFSGDQQETFARISAMLSDASSACGKALDQVERVRSLLK